MEKILSLKQLSNNCQKAKANNQRIVFTNGCFDLIHPGHISYLKQARALGDLLVIAINSDASIQRIKGPLRPILFETERATVLAALEMVSYVTIFDEETPHKIISTLLPDVLVKGGDWSIDKIVGRQEVEANGGKVYSLPYVDGASTTDIITRILSRYHNSNEHQTSSNNTSN
ncbi:MAG: D-glycero-beta-D-manno-heptose 1-phosphate adenylyltransferase [Acidobacteria bacterium]|nr:D-glycero-beta-D-manno-heptose 1-phosphate adenylyltransferase [Acidobacteriota bacterium]